MGDLSGLTIGNYKGFMSTQSAIRVYHRLGGLNKAHLFSQFWRLGSPRSRCWQSLVLVRACFLVCRQPLSLCVLTWPLCVYACVERGGSPGASSSSYKDTNPIVEVPPSWPHLNLISSQRPHLQIPSNLGFRFQHNQFGDGGYEPSAHNSDTSGIIHYIAFWVSAKCIWDSMMLLCQ